MATSLSFSQQVERFEGNESRANTFVNGDSTSTWTTTGGEILPSISKIIQENSLGSRIYSTASGTSSALVLTTNTGIASYTNNATFAFTGTVSNSASSTIKVDDGPAAPVYRLSGGVVGSGDIVPGRRYEIRYSTALAGFELFPLSRISLQATTLADGKQDLSGTFQALNDGDKTRVYIMPKGSGQSGAPAAIKIFADDFNAQPVEYRDMGIFFLPKSSVGSLSATTAPAHILLSSKTGTFTHGEALTGSLGGAGTLRYRNKNYLFVKPITTPFQVGETVTGATSGVTGVIESIDTSGSTWSPYGAVILNQKTGSGSAYRGLNPDMIFGYDDVVYTAQVAGRIIYGETTEGSAFQPYWIFGPSADWKGGVGVSANCIAQFERDILFSSNGTGIRFRNSADTANDTYTRLDTDSVYKITVGGGSPFQFNSAGTLTVPSTTITKAFRATVGVLPYVNSSTPLAVNPTALGKTMTCTLTGDALLGTSANVVAQDEFEIIFLNAAGGPYTVTFSAGWRSDVASFTVSAGKSVVLSVKCTTAGSYYVISRSPELTLRT